MKIIVLFVLIVSLIGCSSGRTTNEVFIRDTTYIVKPVIVEGSGTPQIKNDSLVEYSYLKGNDTTVLIQYLPGLNIFRYRTKTDTIKVDVRDTLFNTVIQEKIIETPFLSKAGLALMGFFLGSGLIIGLGYYFKSKKD